MRLGASAGELRAGALHPGAPRIGAQANQAWFLPPRRIVADPVLGCLGLGEEGVYLGHGTLRKARERRPAESLVVAPEGRATQPLGPSRRGRPDLERAETGVCGFLEPFGVVLAGVDLFRQPPRELVGVLRGGAAETEGPADLRPVVFGRPTRPVADGVLLGGDADLASDAGDGLLFDLLADRKATLSGEEPRKDGEPRARESSSIPSNPSLGSTGRKPTTRGGRMSFLLR